jgi:tetratricopeptide (TPR) repeat protein
MDSVLILTKIALSLDDHLSEPYTLRGSYYDNIGKPEQAIEEYDKAIKLNPNDWMAYLGKGDLYYSYTNLVNSIDNYQKAASINRGRELPSLLRVIGGTYFDAGFPEKAKQYYQDGLKLDGDSSAYYERLSDFEFWLANFNKSIEYAKKGLAIDSNNYWIERYLGPSYEVLGQHEESLKYYKKWFEILKINGEISIQQISGLGYAYLKNGYKEKAEYCFKETINNCKKLIELKRSYKPFAYYDLAAAYASIGDKDKAYKNLRIFNQIQRIPFWQEVLIKTDPLFNSIRNEPEFQQISKDIEAKYQAEHERVRKWLEEQGML